MPDRFRAVPRTNTPRRGPDPPTTHRATRTPTEPAQAPQASRTPTTPHKRRRHPAQAPQASVAGDG
ncbi:hypothetical protein RGQ21_60930 [Kitasatospora aureofaciens]|nr:hypothetical protein RGQ21_60930 [Kitasatospora aureofaciens]